MRRVSTIDAGLFALGMSILLFAPFVGALSLSPQQIFEPGVESDVFWKLRLPRVVLGFLVGSVLSIAGFVFQQIFHNPLASPFTLGVSSGATFGAALSIYFGLGVLGLGVPAHAPMACVAALGTVALVFAFSARSLNFNSTQVLLAGVICNFFFGSLVVLVQYLSDLSQVFSVMRWMMGTLDVEAHGVNIPIGVSLLACTAYLIRKAEVLDLIALGDEMAVARGVSVTNERRALFLFLSVLIGLVVTVVGPIGFVGIIIPHIARSLYGPRSRALIVRCAWIGGVVLVFCDSIGRSLVYGQEIPVGVVTSLVGAPIFVYLMLKNRL
jgi:iron complex transport system permease protein